MTLGKSSASRLGGGADTASRTIRRSLLDGRQALLSGLMSGTTLGCRGHLVLQTDRLGLSAGADTRYGAEHTD